MKKKFIIWFNRLFKKDKPTLNDRTKHLFKAFESITEDCSAISKAKVFNMFKEQLESHFFEQQKDMFHEAKKYQDKAVGYGTAFSNIK